MSAAQSLSDLRALGLRHFRVGWVLLAVCAGFGVVLDALHAFKVGAYLDVGSETRRFMWTLAHAHGLGLGLLHIGHGATLRAGVLSEPSRKLVRGSACLVWAGVLIPAGFFLGGVFGWGADPSVGVALVPIGGVLLVVGIVCVAAELLRAGP